MHYTPLSGTSSPCNPLLMNLGICRLVQATVGVGNVLIWDFCVAITRGGGVQPGGTPPAILSPPHATLWRSPPCPLLACPLPAQPVPMHTLSLCLLLCGLLLAAGEAFSPAAYPNPMTDPDRCGRAQGGWVCDPDAALSPAARDQAQAIVQTIEKECRHKCQGEDRGYQVAVAVLDRMDPQFEPYHTALARAKAFATALGDRWGVGNVGCDDGVCPALCLETENGGEDGRPPPPSPPPLTAHCFLIFSCTNSIPAPLLAHRGAVVSL